MGKEGLYLDERGICIKRGDVGKEEEGKEKSRVLFGGRRDMGEGKKRGRPKGSNPQGRVGEKLRCLLKGSVAKASHLKKKRPAEGKRSVSTSKGSARRIFR